jgi:predicted transcriptional regulator
MKTVSLRIEDSIFGETEKILERLKKPRNRYINEAIDHYNHLQRRLILERKLKIESDLVKKDSLSVLGEFERADYGG